jgi:hypothetical protein
MNSLHYDTNEAKEGRIDYLLLPIICNPSVRPSFFLTCLKEQLFHSFCSHNVQQSIILSTSFLYLHFKHETTSFCSFQKKIVPRADLDDILLQCNSNPLHCRAPSVQSNYLLFPPVKFGCGLVANKECNTYLVGNKVKAYSDFTLYFMYSLLLGMSRHMDYGCKK